MPSVKPGVMRELLEKFPSSLPAMCIEESEQMGEHTAQDMQVERSKGAKLTWRRTSKEKALGSTSWPVCMHVMFACVNTCLRMSGFKAS